ncbi:hypothetical protein CF15_07410 [Pyrodictium occultum]|uniref:Glutamyl-tRNA reductase n=1 Tax=Pyrodictium occultum TaxID=2309 RepID=A0A0V8RWW0_PYROC|nr:glutamyl-tRNA reductase [Pyrodictium occultum]KSW12539.1 hypothetical protein CF15_07410 [Pyrodictium occultum]
MVLVARPLEDLVVVTVNHRTAPLRVVGALEPRAGEAYERLHAHTDEMVVLATCNRFEVYALYSPRLLAEAESFLGSYARYARVLRGLDAARHLFRVASGLESAILGEDEILGQVAKAYEEARRRGHAGKYMSLLFHYAVKTGKLVRSRTQISYGNVGAPGAAVHAAEKLLGSYDRRTVLVVGAGEAGSIIASLVRQKSRSARIIVANRTLEKAAELAERVRGEAHGLDELPGLLEGADVVFLAVTAREPLITRSMLERVRPGTLIVDVSNPPAVEQPVPEHLGYIGLQGLERVIEKTLERRRMEVPKAGRMIEEQLALFRKAWMRRAADEAITVMMEYAGQVVEEELRELQGRLQGLGVDGAAASITRDFAQSLAKKLLRPLIVYAHRAAENGRTGNLEELVEMFRREIEKKTSARPERDSPARGRPSCPR